MEFNEHYELVNTSHFLIILLSLCRVSSALTFQHFNILSCSVCQAFRTITQLVILCCCQQRNSNMQRGNFERFKNKKSLEWEILSHQINFLCELLDRKTQQERVAMRETSNQGFIFAYTRLEEEIWKYLSQVSNWKKLTEFHWDERWNWETTRVCGECYWHEKQHHHSLSTEWFLKYFPWDCPRLWEHRYRAFQLPAGPPKSSNQHIALETKSKNFSHLCLVNFIVENYGSFGNGK